MQDMQKQLKSLSILQNQVQETFWRSFLQLDSQTDKSLKR
jgi:hypothetical protein